ncbi:hypothetical protein DQ238_13895 [Geodermatophilus sp. TF02-6]|nr:hypothetical protein DQ238_13895 [Geodermatophilus sp. TF02-6]
MRMRQVVALAVVAAVAATTAWPTKAYARPHCGRGACPDVGAVDDGLSVSYLTSTQGNTYLASNDSPAPQPYRYRLRTPCEVDTAAGDVCRPDDDVLCPAPQDRIVRYVVIEQQRLVIAGDPGVPESTTTIDGTDPGGAALGSPVGSWASLNRACVDITALNPPPSPGEVYRYFQTLPLPQLPTKQQPPGNALVGLPVVFYTDGPTTQTFTVDIRGFTVDIVATATGFTWRTGDGTTLTSTEPGAPYPNHTVSHDYRSGTYTASLTTTWSGTFSIDGGASADVPGTTTTDGPPVTFTVLQAHAVLTDPYD